MVVLRGQDGWFVHFDGREHGPYPFRSTAVRSAIEAARLAENLGHAVHVREVVRPSCVRVLWPRPKGNLRRVTAA